LIPNGLQRSWPDLYREIGLSEVIELKNIDAQSVSVKHKNDYEALTACAEETAHSLWRIKGR